MSSDQRIAVVGAGIAGASLSYFVHEYVDPAAEVVVFEADDEIGGRIRELTVGGTTVETGAKFVLPWNRYMAGFIDEFGLPTRETTELTAQRIGIWHGDNFAFETSRWDWLTALKMLRRYGLGIRAVQPAVDEVIEGVGRVYEEPLASNGFRTPRELLEAIELTHLTDRTGTEYFEAIGVPTAFVREFFDGAARSIYAQDEALNAFVSLIVLSAVGGTDQPFAVEGGNAQVCHRLLAAAGAEVRTGTPVRRVTRDPTATDTAYSLEPVDGTDERFDAVCLATPLETTDLDIENVDLPHDITDRRYVTVHVSVVAGRLEPGYFDRRTADDIPGFVLTTAAAEDPFMFLLKRGETADGTEIYQLWSRRAGDEERLDTVFSRIDDHRTVTWEAFPELSPDVPMPPFRLAPGLYYVNAAESIASAMEAEAIGSRNVANLLADDLGNGKAGTGPAGPSG